MKFCSKITIDKCEKCTMHFNYDIALYFLFARYREQVEMENSESLKRDKPKGKEDDLLFAQDTLPFSYFGFNLFIGNWF